MFRIGGAEESYMDRRAPSGSGKGFWASLLLLAVTIAIVLVLGVAGYLFYLLAKLPKVDRLADYKPPIVSQVFGDDGTLVGEFYLERRIVVPVNKMPRRLIQAFVAAEDANFYSHKGIDYLGIVRAAVKNIVSGGQEGRGLHHNPAGDKVDAFDA